MPYLPQCCSNAYSFATVRSQVLLGAGNSLSQDHHGAGARSGGVRERDFSVELHYVFVLFYGMYGLYFNILEIVIQTTVGPCIAVIIGACCVLKRCSTAPVRAPK